VGQVRWGVLGLRCSHFGWGGVGMSHICICNLQRARTCSLRPPRGQWHLQYTTVNVGVRAASGTHEINEVLLHYTTVATNVCGVVDARPSSPPIGLAPGREAACPKS